MNRLVKGIAIVAVFATTAVRSTTVPYLSFRSQGFNAARELVGWQSQINKYDMCNFYGSFSVAPEYTKSFRPCTIAQYLFNDALVKTCDKESANSAVCPTIKIQGLDVKNRDPRALMAENFYLPRDYDSSVTFKPTIENGIVDFNLYLGLDNIAENLYFRIHAPVCYTKWNLHFCENVLNAGNRNTDCGDINNTYTPASDFRNTGVYGLSRSQLVATFEDYVSNCSTITGVENITYNPLNYARMSRCARTKTAVAEVSAALGWNFWNCDDYTLGIQIRGAAPTGNRPRGTWLFEPVVGQGKHWELGGGIDLRWTLSRSCDENKDWTLYLDANITHLFNTRQCRTFDICNKPLSRYMLAMKFTDKVESLVAGDTQAAAIAPNYQFAKEFAPVANLTTLPVEVSAAVQGELALKIAYTHCNWQFDVGYDFWGRSCEKICTPCDCTETVFKDNVWGLKGDAFAFGFRYDATVPNELQPAIPLSTTQSAATIFGAAPLFTVPSDNVKRAWSGTSATDLPLQYHIIGALITGPAARWDNSLTSLQPVLLTANDIDFNGARTKSLSNKVFAHIGYTFQDCECVTPYLGLGGEAEFGIADKKFNSTQCALGSTAASVASCGKSCCSAVSLSQWGVWIKGGISFHS